MRSHLFTSLTARNETVGRRPISVSIQFVGCIWTPRRPKEQKLEWRQKGKGGRISRGKKGRKKNTSRYEQKGLSQYKPSLANKASVGRSVHYSSSSCIFRVPPRYPKRKESVERDTTRERNERSVLNLASDSVGVRPRKEAQVGNGRVCARREERLFLLAFSLHIPLSRPID